MATLSFTKGLYILRDFKKFTSKAVPNITVAIGSTRELMPSEILYTDSTDYLLGGALTLKNGRIDMFQFDEGDTARPHNIMPRRTTSPSCTMTRTTWETSCQDGILMLQ
jgi:hypothetical protein